MGTVVLCPYYIAVRRASVSMILALSGMFGSRIAWFDRSKIILVVSYRGMEAFDGRMTVLEHGSNGHRRASFRPDCIIIISDESKPHRQR